MVSHIISAGSSEARTEHRVAATGYQSGFANHFTTEGVPGALPIGRNSPQIPPLGLYAELLSGTAFTAPRAENRRTWTYRIQPSAVHRPYRRIQNGRLRSALLNQLETTPSQLRWNPPVIPSEGTDFIDGLITMGANGDVRMQTGMAAHLYAANASMSERYFYNADGEMLMVPQQGSVRFVTELGVMDVRHGDAARAGIWRYPLRTQRAEVTVGHRGHCRKRGLAVAAQ